MASKAVLSGEIHLQGVFAAVIAAWIGHKDANLTMELYAHSQDDALKAAGALSERASVGDCNGLRPEKRTAWR
jgi:hypothetical protein